MAQNTSHAVMAQRNRNMDVIDNFPTPPWAVRAFISANLDTQEITNQNCLEPACGQGYMSEVLKEYFAQVTSSDIMEYGYDDMSKVNFLDRYYGENSFDWVITNPPFKIAEDFIRESQRVARKGVAMLVRTVFIESVGRYERLFAVNPPSYFSQYVERVAMVKGRLDRRASTATGYGWIVWENGNVNREPVLKWIPPSRKKFEREEDYEDTKQESLF